MKKLKKYRAKSTRDDFPTVASHIHSMHIRAFVSEGVDFTEKETAHFDVCRECRLEVVDAFRNLAPEVAGRIETNVVVLYSRLSATEGKTLSKMKQEGWRPRKQQRRNAA